MRQTADHTLAGLMGVCVGDALGVPVEFSSRTERVKSPVKTMLGYGTFNQPPGTWSDDSSLTFCLAEALCNGFSPDALAQLNEAIASSFCRWYSEAYWTAHGNVFDIGFTTGIAIRRLQKGVPPIQAGDSDESSNGNGPLMRILPLAYCYKILNLPELIELTHQVSCLTHAHLRSQIACGIYISIAVCLLQGAEPQSAYAQGIENVQKIYTQTPYSTEISHFQKVFSGNIAALPMDVIKSSGYVIDTLEASLWCFLNSTSYADAVLKAVNLGGDTDTTGAVTGGLAGIYYGLENIPQDWIDQIARKEDIIALARRLEAAIYSSS